MRLPPIRQRIVTAEEMAALDRATIQGAFGRTAVPSLKLMERAGLEAAKVMTTWWRERGDSAGAGGAGTKAASGGRAGAKRGGSAGGAAAAMRRFGGGGSVSILCGRGNNGGDGFVAARHLKAAGFAVRVFVAASADDLSPDARANHEACEKAKIPVTFLPEPRAWGEGSEADNAVGQSSFLVDALLGTGSKGAPRGAIAAAVECAVRAEKPIVAIDIPSGVDATTGHAEAPSIRAEMTVTLALPKAGLALEPGRERAGRLVVVDIGIPSELVAGQRPSHLLASADWARALLPTRAADAHKGTVGRVLFVGGSAGMMGAVALSTESAYRAGAGYVVACVPSSCVDILEARVAEVVKRGVAETAARTLAAGAGDAILAEAMRADVVVLGPGMSRHGESEALARALIRAPRRRRPERLRGEDPSPRARPPDRDAPLRRGGAVEREDDRRSGARSRRLGAAVRRRDRRHRLPEERADDDGRAGGAGDRERHGQSRHGDGRRGGRPERHHRGAPGAGGRPAGSGRRRLLRAWARGGRGLAPTWAPRHHGRRHPRRAPGGALGIGKRGAR
jgi:hydroxyethylthiazole kinase-like uncharacterized protein yjeF